jgi:formylglycine-generating enzyme required for sulfatase activity
VSRRGAADSFKYRAFLSYSHADTAVAKRVHYRLENFRIDPDLVGRVTKAGPVPPTLAPIFRDRHEFEAGSSLTEQTLAALSASGALILLASPRSAKSIAVNEEIRLFKFHHADRPIIPLIVDGVHGDESAECFPPALRFHLSPDGSVTMDQMEVLAADLREEADGFELAIAKVIAGLIGLPPDDIYRRADRERRKLARRSRRVHALIYTLMVSVIAGLIGWMNQDYIKEQWVWSTKLRPYMRAYVRPYTLPIAEEEGLVSGQRFRECKKDCPEMIVIPPGKFTMGSSQAEEDAYLDEDPPHEVTIAKAFAVSKFDVTFADWNACVVAGGCSPVSDQGMPDPTLPVFNVSLDDAKQYVNWFATMTGKPYRLLTESEWEYAARAGATTVHYWGDDLKRGVDYCDGCIGISRIAPVGSFKPNPFALYDMEGNVWQWVQDCYHDDYNGAPQNGSAWLEDDCKQYVARGGAYNGAPRRTRLAVRVRRAPTARAANLGFRIARSLSPTSSVAGDK